MEAFYYGQLLLIARKRREEEEQQEQNLKVNGSRQNSDNRSLVSSVSRGSLQSDSSNDEHKPLTVNSPVTYNSVYDGPNL